jgi:surface protein
LLTLLFEHPFIVPSLPPSIEWIQNTAAATTAWGDIGDWDVSGVADFSWAFSKHRDVAGGSNVPNGNPKAVTFVGTAISKWTTTSVTTLLRTFYNAGEMNSDLSKWNVAKVTTLSFTFTSASKFAGAGLGSWDTTSVTNLQST